MNTGLKITILFIASAGVVTAIYLMVKNSQAPSQNNAMLSDNLPDTTNDNTDISAGIDNVLNDVTQIFTGNQNNADTTTDNASISSVNTDQPASPQTEAPYPIVTAPNSNSDIWLQANKSTNVRMGYGMNYPSIRSYDQGNIVGTISKADYDNTTNLNSWLVLKFFVEDNNNIVGTGGYIQKKDVNISNYNPANA